MWDALEGGVKTRGGGGEDEKDFAGMIADRPTSRDIGKCGSRQVVLAMIRGAFMWGMSSESQSRENRRRVSRPKGPYIEMHKGTPLGSDRYREKFLNCGLARCRKWEGGSYTAGKDVGPSDPRIGRWVRNENS